MGARLSLAVALVMAAAASTVAGISTTGAPVAAAATSTPLSDLVWISATNGFGPVERDMSNGGQAAGDGRAITLNATTYAKGLGTHAASDVRYSLSGQYTSYAADIGVDDECGSSGSVIFQVYADSTKIFDSGRMTGTTETKHVAVTVTGKSQLRLVVTNAGDGTACDHADWADATLTGTSTPTTSTTTTSTTSPPTGDPVLVGAGDIASCSWTGDEATANLLDAIPGTVFTAGDNAYPKGSSSSFTDCYGPSWGRHKSRTRPATGNHEYDTAGASGHFGYFGAAAGDPTKGYYSYNLGSWHVVVVNSNCSQIGGCGAGSPQEQWVRLDLAANTLPCTAAYWHHPLFTSGVGHSNDTEMRPIFQALYDYNAEVVLSGHNHNYERFAPQDPNGNLDTTRGIREFVVGMGGATLTGFAAIQPNSQVRNGDTYGVMKLTLKANGYDWDFVPEAGKTFSDVGSDTCH